MSLSAVLIVKNEEKNIEACLGALEFADEVVVVDSGSSDRTTEIVRSRFPKARLGSRRFDDFASQKNYAVDLARMDWVLSIDADERVGAALKDEILRVIARPDAADAYRIHRKTNLFGRDFVASGLQDDAPIRLFRSRRGIFFRQAVHETPDVAGKKLGVLKSRLYHRSFQTVSEHWAKMQFYTDVEARASAGPLKGGAFGLFFMRPFYRFFRIYVLKQGFRDGREGFVYAVLSAYYEWVRWMKKWEIDRVKQ